MALFFGCIVGVFLVSLTSLSFGANLVCYYVPYAEETPGKLQAKDIPPHLCTHIIILGFGTSFAKFPSDNASQAEWDAIAQFHYKPAMSQLQDLKKVNPFLKIIVCHGHSGGAVMSDFMQNSSHARFVTWARAVLRYARKNHVDGMDMDYEYLLPRATGHGFMRYLKAFREVIDAEHNNKNERFLLTIAAANSIILLTESYPDMATFAASLDMVNFMGYDYHMSIQLLTGHLSPLFHSKEDFFVTKLLNAAWTTQFFLKGGVRPDQITMGLPSYADVWELLQPATKHTLYSPSKGQLPSLNSTSICKYLRDPDTQVVWDSPANASYAWNRRTNAWASYDSYAALSAKCRYIHETKISGAMIWVLNSDYDPGNLCKTGHVFPVHQFMRNCLEGKLDGLPNKNTR